MTGGARLLAVFVMASAAASAGCGKKGAPLAPLHLVPPAPTEVALRRTGSEVRLSFLLPATNVGGPGPSVLDRVQVYAVTVPPGAAPPPNRELLTPAHLAGTVAVKPPPVEGEAAPEKGAQPAGSTPAGQAASPGAAADTRPSAGEKATFVETLTPEKLAGAPQAPASGKGPRPAAGAGIVAAALATPAAAPGAATLAALAAAAPVSGPAAIAAAAAVAASSGISASIPTHAVRVYALQGVTKKGRPGPVSARVELPIVAVPPVPTSVLATASETAISLTWVSPPAVAAGGATPATPATTPGPAPAAAAPMFNVYARGGSDPLNPAPLAAPPFERPGVTWGREECFVVRSVEKPGAITIESDPSEPACLTPRDTFPPAPPKALSVVAGPGVMNLSWDANAEPDFAGYLVLRGEAGGGALKPITPAPITATNYEDRSVTPGVRYAYAVVAVDRATPPNQSPPSGRVEETAR